MKINQLTFENFRNHARTDLDLDRINFFVGRNNSGKTSIKAAIEYGFTGSCQWTDRSGRGAADLVRRGEKKAMVAMTFTVRDSRTTGDDTTHAAGDSRTTGDGTHVAGDILTTRDGTTHAAGRPLATGESLVRSLVPHSLQFGRAQGVIEAQTALYNKLNTTEENLRLALNATRFLSFTPAEQKAFLFSACGLVFTPQKIAHSLREWLTAQGQDADTAARLAEKAYRYSPLDRTGGPEIIEAMEKLARDDRKMLKRERQKIEATRQEISICQNPRYDAQKMEAIQEKLQELKAQRDQILQAIGSSQAEQVRRQNLLLQKERLTEEYHYTQQRINELKNRMKELLEEPLAGLSEELLKELLEEPLAGLSEELLKELLEEPLAGLSVRPCPKAPLAADGTGIDQDLEQTRQSQIAELTSKIAQSSARLETIRQAGEALTAADKRCPLAPDLIPCSMSDQEREQILDLLAAEYLATSKELASAQSERDLLKAELNDLQTKRAEIQAKRAESLAKQTQIAASREELGVQQALLQKTAADLERVEKELAAISEPVGPDAAAELKQRLAQVDQQIRQQEASLAEAGRGRVMAEKKVQLEDELTQLTQEMAEQELLVKSLGADGLPRELLTTSLDQLFTRINDRLGRLTEGAYQLQYTSEMELICRVAGGPLLPLRLLSSSEQFRVGIALQEALSAQSGLRLLAIDQSDVFDQDNRDLLAGMLIDTAAEYDQAFIFTTVGDTPPKKPDLPGVKLFWVENGTVREL